MSKIDTPIILVAGDSEYYVPERCVDISDVYGFEAYSCNWFELPEEFEVKYRKKGKKGRWKTAKMKYDEYRWFHERLEFMGVKYKCPYCGKVYDDYEFAMVCSLLHKLGIRVRGKVVNEDHRIAIYKKSFPIIIVMWEDWKEVYVLRKLEDLIKFLKELRKDYLSGHPKYDKEFKEVLDFILNNVNLTKHEKEEVLKNLGGESSRTVEPIAKNEGKENKDKWKKEISITLTLEEWKEILAILESELESLDIAQEEHPDDNYKPFIERLERIHQKIYEELKKHVC